MPPATARLQRRQAGRLAGIDEDSAGDAAAERDLRDFEPGPPEDALSHVGVVHVSELSARSLKRWILPVAVFGKSVRNSITPRIFVGGELRACSAPAGCGRARRWPGPAICSTTNAFGLISPSASGQATTAASSTSGWRAQRAFDLERRDINAADLQHVVAAAAIDEEAVLVLAIFVAGAGPFPQEGGARLRAVVPVHDGAGRPAHLQLADLALLHRPPASSTSRTS